MAEESRRTHDSGLSRDILLYGELEDAGYRSTIAFVGYRPLRYPHAPISPTQHSHCRPPMCICGRSRHPLQPQCATQHLSAPRPRPAIYVARSTLLWRPSPQPPPAAASWLSRGRSSPCHRSQTSPWRPAHRPRPRCRLRVGLIEGVESVRGRRKTEVR